jgi:hypothetical protein
VAPTLLPTTSGHWYTLPMNYGITTMNKYAQCLLLNGRLIKWCGNIIRGAQIAERHLISESQEKRVPHNDITDTNHPHIVLIIFVAPVAGDCTATSAFTREVQQHLSKLLSSLFGIDYYYF